MRKLLLILIASAVITGAIGALLPDQFEVERSIVVAAPSATVHEFIDDLRRWDEWSVWKERDPAMLTEFSGPAKGVDAKMAWRSEQESLSTGDLTITSSHPDKGVWMDVNLAGTANKKAVISYAPVAGGTEVTWTERGNLGKNPYRRYLSLLMDKLLGPDFDSNLAKIKALAEAHAGSDE